MFASSECHTCNAYKLQPAHDDFQQRTPTGPPMQHWAQIWVMGMGRHTELTALGSGGEGGGG